MPCTTDDPQTPEAESRNLDEPSGNTASQERANAPLPSEAELGKPDEPSDIVNHNNDNNHNNTNDPSPHATVEELRNPDNLLNDDPDGDGFSNKQEGELGQEARIKEYTKVGMTVGQTKDGSGGK